MESGAVERVFVDSPLCSSIKPMVGHCLGAAGAIEAGCCWLILSQENDPLALPPHCWDQEQDEELPSLKLVESGDAIPVQKEVHICSNSFAFGGNNCSLIIGKTFDE